MTKLKDFFEVSESAQALYAYVHTLRSFNGDWSWDPLEAAAHLFHLGRSIWVRRLGLGRPGRPGRPRIAAYVMDRKHTGMGGMGSFQDRIGEKSRLARDDRSTTQSLKPYKLHKAWLGSSGCGESLEKSWEKPWEKHGKKTQKNHQKIASLRFWTAGYKSSQIHPA